jgi:hypothetical protein
MRCLKAFVGVLAGTAAALMVLGGSAYANPLTSPAGTSYMSTLKAEAETAFTLTSVFGGFGAISCKKSSFEGKVESSTTTTASGKLSSLTFGECDHPMTVLKPGSLQVEQIGSGKATVRWSGAEITAHETLFGECRFVTSSTDIGTLTDSSITGGNATLDLSGKVPTSNECGTGTLEGSYKFTTPNPLYAD